MKKLPPGIFKRKTCWKCTAKVPVKTKNNSKRKATNCAGEATCPDKKKFEADFYIRYRYKGKLVKERVGPRLMEAKKALESRKGDMTQGKFKLEEIRPGLILQEFAIEKYLPYAKQHKRSWDRDELSIKHLVDHLGSMYLRQITKWNVEKFKSERSKEINPNTKRIITGSEVNRELACLKTIFNRAIEWGFADKNPVKGVKFYDENRRERYLTEEEFSILLSHCNRNLRVIVLLAVYGGMRKSEILELRWKDINLRKGVITIESKDSKSKEVGHVHLNSVLTEELRAIKIIGSEFVFPGQKGGHLTDIKTPFNTALRKAGITDFHFHDLRHTFASHLAMMGNDTLTIQILGRWKTQAMVNRYAHLSKKHLKDAVEDLGNALSTIPNVSPEKKKKRTVS